jgi:hypothetical protein
VASRPERHPCSLKRLNFLQSAWGTFIARKAF